MEKRRDGGAGEGEMEWEKWREGGRKREGKGVSQHMLASDV